VPVCPILAARGNETNAESLAGRNASKARMTDLIEWRVHLPIVGIKLAAETSKLSMGAFAIESYPKCRGSDEEHNGYCISFALVGQEVPDEKTCRWCPRRAAAIKPPAHVGSENDRVVVIPQAECACLILKEAGLSDVPRFGQAVLENALAVVRFYVSVRHGLVKALNIISLDRLPSYAKIVSLSSRGARFAWNTIPRRRMYDVGLNSDDVRGFEILSMNRILDNVRLSHLSDAVDELDEAITAAIVWCGHMLEDQHPRDCFLRGATSLESILASSMGKIGKNFESLGAALGVIGFAPDVILDPVAQIPVDLMAHFNSDRQRLASAWKSRCSISHGSSSISDESDQPVNEFGDLFIKACVGALWLWTRCPGREAFDRELQRLNARFRAQ
jgi:hypothetical protein